MASSFGSTNSIGMGQINPFAPAALPNGGGAPGGVVTPPVATPASNSPVQPGQPISVSGIQNPQTPAQVPTSPTSPNYSAIQASGNAILQSLASLQQQQATGTPAPAAPSDLSSMLQQYLGSQTPPPSATDTYNQDLANSNVGTLQTNANTDMAAVKDSQGELDSVNAQLAGLNAQSQAIPIQDQQNAQGRGITEAGLAPITASEQRANALQAIPLQAQAIAAQAKVAAAQGNASLSSNLLTQAQNQLDKVFQLQMTDAQAQYKYQQDQITAVYDYATKAQQAQLDAQKLQAQQDFTTQQNNLNYAQQLSTAAINAGQANVAAKIAALDPKSPTYQQQVASLAGQINPTLTVAQKNAGAGSSSGSTYQAGMLTSLLQSQGKTADDTTLQGLWSQYGSGGAYANDTAHNSVIYSKMTGQSFSPTGSASPTSSTNSNTLQGMRNYYQTTGKLPAFGLSANNPLRAQFYAALGGATGQTTVSQASTNAAIRTGLQKAYSTQQNQYSANQTAIGTLDQQLNLAQNYSNQVSRADSPLVNQYLIAVKSNVFGDPATAALNNIVTTASYEFAKILSGASASISGTTVTSAADAKNLLNSAMSQGQFNTVLNLMKQEAQIRLSAQKDTMTQMKSDLSNIGTLTSALTSTPTTSTGSTGTIVTAPDGTQVQIID